MSEADCSHPAHQLLHGILNDRMPAACLCLLHCLEQQPGRL